MMIEDREAFLRAIVAAPDDDLPRLVYADYLEENGQPDHAELIRLQCWLTSRTPNDIVAEEIWQHQTELIRTVNVADGVEVTHGFANRGFRACECVILNVSALGTTADLRRQSVTTRPEWWGCNRLKLSGGRIISGGPFETVFAVPAFEQVDELDLTGEEVHSRYEDSSQSAEYVVRPTISVPGLEALLRNPRCRRLRVLNLQNNDLDNDALRYLATAQHLIRLESLELSHGNRFRGRVWQQVVERFGENVVR
jgi:uncharacterized protein (TIGR02996 family)